jgi:hypothetical protein
MTISSLIYTISENQSVQLYIIIVTSAVSFYIFIMEGHHEIISRHKMESNMNGTSTLASNAEGEEQFPLYFGNYEALKSIGYISLDTCIVGC